MMGLKIMIVDDTMFMRQILRGIVEEEGWIVIGEAVDGAERAEVPGISSRHHHHGHRNAAEKRHRGIERDYRH